MKKLFYLLFLSIIISCSSNNTNEETEVEVTPTKGIVSFTSEQTEIAGIKTGSIKKQTISETIECTGSIDVPPGNIASVSPIIVGFVKSINYSPGDQVNKGDILARLQHPDFIQMQQQYLEAKSQAEYYKEEYKRQGELTVENAASIKKMQKAKSDFLSSEAMYKSLKAQLELLGVNTTKIENDDFEKEFKIHAPISGTLAQMNANTGTFVSPENIMFEIINSDYIFLKLRVFEKDIPNVSQGQRIKFHLLNDTSQYFAKVDRMGISIDKVNRTTMVYSKVEKKSIKLDPGKFVNASIYISDRTTFTIPSNAVVEYNNEYYVFVKNESDYKLTKVNKGIEQNGFTEILNPDENLLKADIVINGTYYLLSKLEAEE